jgi:hypothetical protein
VLEDGVILRSEANLAAARTAEWDATRKTAVQQLLARLTERDALPHTAVNALPTIEGHRNNIR